MIPRSPSLLPHLVIALAVIIGAVGCGRRADIGRVSGTITLDGQPLPEAVVTFQPDPRGAPSRGITDSKGFYRLRYSHEHLGAPIGKHVVSVSTYRAANPDADPPRSAVPEKVPPRFNGESELRAEVSPGGNTIDFALGSQGPVPQPSLVGR
jgi:hypothetical protein